MRGAFFNRMVNIGKQEWPRVILAWSINLCLRAGFVIGWTVTVGMFIHRMGIEALPYLFVLNALLIMLGSIAYSALIKHIKRPLLMVYTILMGTSLLLLSTLFVRSNPVIFFGIVLLAQSILLAQLNILIGLFTEDLFSPLESQRTFPLIATAETMGGIIGGLTVGLLSGYMATYKFIYLWIFAILMIIPIILTSHAYGQKMMLIKIQNEETQLENRTMQLQWLKKFKATTKKILKIPFLNGMVLLVMFQFLLTNIMEFQYTKAVQNEILQRESVQFELTEYKPETTLKVSLLNLKKPESVPSPTTSHNTEEELMKNLGLLLMIFSLGSLAVQFLVASRIIGSLGIVRTLLIHPLITLIGLIGMTLKFNFLSATITRSSFEITSKLFYSAYHSSYYAIPERMRDQFKEFTEGLIKPLGAIAAFGIMMTAQNVASGAYETVILNASMLLIGLVMGVRLIWMQTHYTKLSSNNLENSEELPTRLNAIEILSQRGHKIEKETLIKHLHNKKETESIRLKIIEAIEAREETQYIDDLLECTTDHSEELRFAAWRALGKFSRQKFGNQKELAFTRHRAIETAKKMIPKEKNEETREAILELLTSYEQDNAATFILELIHGEDKALKRAGIKACREFKDDSVVHYLLPHLNDEDPLIRAETIASLWESKKVRKKLTHYLKQLKKNPKQDAVLASIYLFGEIHADDEEIYLLKQLSSGNPKVQEAAIRALAKINHRGSADKMAELIDTQEMAERIRTKKFIKNLDLRLVESIQALVERKMSDTIHKIIQESGAQHLEDLSLEMLKKLKNAYATVDEHEEVYRIEKRILKKEKEASKKYSIILTPNESSA